MVIGFRVRPPHGGYLKLGLYVHRDHIVGSCRELGIVPAPSLLSASMELFLKEMDEAGVTAAVVTGRKAVSRGENVPNREVADLVREHPGRFYGFAGVDLGRRESALRDVEEGVTELGLSGVALEPGSAPTPMYADDRRMYPIYQRCLELGALVMITASHHAGPDMTWGDPVHIDRVAIDFPTLPIIVAHGCWPYVIQMLGVAQLRRNVYVMPDHYLFNMPGAEEYVKAANFYLEDNFLFGTSYPIASLPDAVREFRALPFKESVLPKVLHGNAARLLKL